jgi:hypothetical protein
VRHQSHEPMGVGSRADADRHSLLGFDHTREADGRAAPAARFDQLWVVDRNLPDLFEVLAAITRPERFDAIVLTAADSSRVEVVNHLLEFAPPGTIHWVSRDPVPVGMSVDRIPDPRGPDRRRSWGRRGGLRR